MNETIPDSVSRETSAVTHGGVPEGAIRVVGLKAGYGKTERLEIPELIFPRGTIIAVLGPNGSGKSTLLRSLTRSLRPLQGAVILDGHNIASLSAAQIARNLTFLPQEAQFPFHFTPRELVTMGVEASGRSGTDAEDRIIRSLSRFEMNALADVSLTALSGGERQRAALARAFAQARQYLLLDEPTTYLDLRHQAVLCESLKELARPPESLGIVIVLHDLNLAASFAERIVLLAEGRIVAQGPPDSVLTEEEIARVYRTHVRLSRDSRNGTQWFNPERPSTP